MKCELKKFQQNIFLSFLQSHRSLERLSELTQLSVTTIMEPHREILADMIPPKKHLLKHQPVSTQIALMDGNTFCTSLSPRLFSIDLSINEHKVFFSEVGAAFSLVGVAFSVTSCRVWLVTEKATPTTLFCL